MKSLRKYLIMTLCVLFTLAVGLFAASCGDDGKAPAADYTVNVYLSEGDDYALSAEHSFTGSGEVGQEVTVTPPVIAGYVFNETHGKNVVKRILSENAAENLFSLYYDAESAAPAGVRYEANAPRGTTARGSMEESLPAADGNVTLAECGFSVAGYRFAGWSDRANGNAIYTAGQSVKPEGTLTLYAVWDRGYTDRFGGSDLIFVPSMEDGVVYLRRGGVEWKGMLSGVHFSFSKDDGKTLEGTLFSGSQFAYHRSELAGTYLYYSGYMSEDGGVHMPDSAETLEIRTDSSASYTHNAETGGRETIMGSVSYDPNIGLYTFTANNVTDTFEGFVFLLGTHPGENEMDTSDDVEVFSYTYGEGGLYNEFLTPDGRTGVYGEMFVELDGFGNMIYYSDVFEGRYRILNTYDNGSGAVMYRIEANVLDPNEEFGLGPSFTLTFYTLPMSDGSAAYVQPHGEVGTYDSADGTEHITLDGFGILSDSATYTDAEGREHVGPYTVTTSPRTGNTVFFTEISVQNGVPTVGEPIAFRFTVDGDQVTFSKVASSEQYTEYLEIRLADSTVSTSGGMFMPLLTVYEEEYKEGDTVLGKKAEMYLPEGENTVLAAVGYVAAENKGGVTLWRWTKTEDKNNKTEIAGELLVLFDSAYDANYVMRDVYVILEKDGVKQYDVVYDDVGGGELWYCNVGWNTIGTIYTDDKGNSFAGGLTVNRNSYIFGAVAYFIYYDANGASHFIFFDATIGSTGKITTLELLPEGASEDAGLLASNRGSSQTEATFVFRRNGQAAYQKDGNFGDSEAIEFGTYARVGSTPTGDPVYAFYNEQEIERFRFVMTLLETSAMDDSRTYLYYVFDEAASGDYTSADGKLSLDGYRGAVYTDAQGSEWKGTFTLSADGSAVFFTGGGDSFIFAIGDGTFSLLDGIYGVYTFEANNALYDLTFDGRGKVTASLNNREVGEGSYKILSRNPFELLLTLDLGIGEVDYTVSAENGRCVSFDERSDKIFVSADWSVIEMDGYGKATYYSADGLTVMTASVHYFEGENGYARLRYDATFTDEYFIFDLDNGTFSRPVHTEENYFYLSEDMTFLIFATDGNALYENTMCSYYLANGKAYIFVPNASTGIDEKVELPAPTGAKRYTANVGSAGTEKVFYRCKDTDKNPLTETLDVVLSGTITVEGGEDISGVTLSFTLNLLSYEQDMINTYLQLPDSEERYSVTLCTSYWNSAERRYIRGASIMDPYDFTYYPIDVHFVQAGDGEEGKATFTAKGGISNTLRDYVDYRQFLSDYRASHNDENPTEAEIAAAKISSLTETYVGFGSVVFGDRRVSGKLYCGNKEFTFTNAVSHYIKSGDPGRRYLATFEDGGQTYAVIYEKEDEGFYNLYMVATYQEFESDGYVIGVDRFFYGNGFSFFREYEVGDFCGVQLYKKNADGGKTAIPAFDIYAYENGMGFMVEDKEVLDTGYLFSVTLSEDGVPTGAWVKKYEFHQGHTDTTLTEPAYVNFFVDETGTIELGAYIVYRQIGDSLYPTYVEITELRSVNDHTFELTEKGGEKFTITILLGGDGKPLTDRSGDWIVEIV